MRNDIKLENQKVSQNDEQKTLKLELEYVDVSYSYKGENGIFKESLPIREFQKRSSKRKCSSNNNNKKIHKKRLKYKKK